MSPLSKAKMFSNGRRLPKKGNYIEPTRARPGRNDPGSRRRQPLADTGSIESASERASDQTPGAALPRAGCARVRLRPSVAAARAPSRSGMPPRRGLTTYVPSPGSQPSSGSLESSSTIPEIVEPIHHRDAESHEARRIGRHHRSPFRCSQASATIRSRSAYTGDQPSTSGAPRLPTTSTAWSPLPRGPRSTDIYGKFAAGHAPRRMDDFAYRMPGAAAEIEGRAAAPCPQIVQR